MKLKGHLIMSLLRILTPEEISKLTTSHSGQKKVPLSILLCADRDGNNYKDVIEDQRVKAEAKTEEESQEKSGAKILKLGEAQETEVVKELAPKEKFTFQSGPRVERLMNEYSKVFEKMNKSIFGQKRFPKKKGSHNTKQASTLIIEEKKKLYDSYSKIKKMEVLSLYKDTSSIDIENQKRNKDDIGHNTSIGVLINKKQA